MSFLLFLQRHIYGLKGRNIDVFAENSSLAINPHYIQSWLDLLSRTPRVAPFLQKNDPFIAALKKVWPVPTNDIHLAHLVPSSLAGNDTNNVFWCRNYLNTLPMYMFRLMPWMGCSLSMMPLKQLWMYTRYISWLCSSFNIVVQFSEWGDLKNCSAPIYPLMNYPVNQLPWKDVYRFDVECLFRYTTKLKLPHMAVVSFLPRLQVLHLICCSFWCSVPT